MEKKYIAGVYSVIIYGYNAPYGGNPIPPIGVSPTITSNFNLKEIDTDTVLSIPFTVNDKPGTELTAILTRDSIKEELPVVLGENIWEVGTLEMGYHVFKIRVKNNEELYSNELTFILNVIKRLLYMLNGGSFTDTQVGRTFDGGSFSDTSIGRKIDGGTF